MNQSQFHTQVSYHYMSAATKKRLHEINNVIKTIEERKTSAEETVKKHFVKISRGSASKKAEIEYFSGMASLDALDGLLYDMKKIRTEIFQTIDELARRSEPEWNGREPLREPINDDRMREILANV